MKKVNMKLFLVLALTILSGCGLFTTGEGQFTGRVVDVSWEGLVFKSCEIGMQLGEQSSRLSHGSSLDKSFCDKAQTLIGKVATVHYDTYVNPCCLSTDTNYILKSIEAVP